MAVKEPLGVSPRRMKKVDKLSYELWRAYVKPYVKRSIKRTREMKLLFRSGPGPSSKHPIVRRMLRSRRFYEAFDGFQAAMMTWCYLAAVCRHHERVLEKK